MRLKTVCSRIGVGNSPNHCRGLLALDLFEAGINSAPSE
jgi:hypothetical protein